MFLLLKMNLFKSDISNFKTQEQEVTFSNNFIINGNCLTGWALQDVVGGLPSTAEGQPGALEEPGTSGGQILAELRPAHCALVPSGGELRLFWDWFLHPSGLM